MEKQIATQLFESLASGTRLDIYRLLVRYGHDGLVAGQIAAELGLPPNNLSFHLKGMTQSRLLTVEQEGRFQRYRANLPLMRELIAYLTEECCSAESKQCASLRAASPCAETVLPPLKRKTGKETP
ncbi:MAG: arsR2 [Burkholderiaceae bacterium]|nr:arsR2 [Burkholderiaceae bacterium]